MSAIKKNIHVSAFTILEMVIGLVISSLVITMVYVIYENISKQVGQYFSDQKELMKYNQFHNLFSKEIQLSRNMEIIDDGQILLNLNSGKVTYSFEKDYIIRKTNVVDTFQMKVIGLKVGNTGEIAENYQTLRLKTKLLDRDITLFERKEIDLAKRINNYLLNEH